jgi:hypothetical protein
VEPAWKSAGHDHGNDRYEHRRSPSAPVRQYPARATPAAALRDALAMARRLDEITETARPVRGATRRTLGDG